MKILFFNIWWVVVLIVQCALLGGVVYHLYIILLNYKRKERDRAMFIYISILLFILVSFHYLFEALSIVLDRTNLVWPIFPALMAGGIGWVIGRDNKLERQREDEHRKVEEKFHKESLRRKSQPVQ